MTRVTSVPKLTATANLIRQDIITSLVAAGSGHSAGPLGMADVFTALYFNILNHKPKQPLWPQRDRLVLSNGHICPVWYATLARAGYFPLRELKTLRKLNSRLQGHPHRGSLPGVENTGGPLGQGLSIAIGMALAAKMNKQKHHVFCLMSDGEHDEGQTWEAVLAAAKYKLNNLVAIMDRNYIQIDGNTEDVMPLQPVVDKYKAFNWEVIEVDGNNMRQIIAGINQAKAYNAGPVMVVAHTIPGKGVSYMEEDFRWHGIPPGKGPDDVVTKDHQAEVALRQLRRLGGAIKSEID